MKMLPVKDWIARCSARLQARWPTIDPTRLDDLAADLSRQPSLRDMTPETAATEWLRPVTVGEQGMDESP